MCTNAAKLHACGTSSVPKALQNPLSSLSFVGGMDITCIQASCSQRHCGTLFKTPMMLRPSRPLLPDEDEDVDGRSVVFRNVAFHLQVEAVPLPWRTEPEDPSGLEESRGQSRGSQEEAAQAIEDTQDTQAGPKRSSRAQGAQGAPMRCICFGRCFDFGTESEPELGD